MKILLFDDPLTLQCIAIRRNVFIEEQSVPETREQDGLDPIARHYLFLHDARPIGAARSRIADKKIKIERFAFLPSARGLGLGAPAFAAIVQDCLEHYPALEINIGAQAYLKSFYERLGFKAKGDVFKDSNIDHIEMVYTGL